MDTSHGILSLPSEITASIFGHCSSSEPITPSADTAPLLLAQICGEWRELCLDTPDLWAFVSWTDRKSVELLKLWLFRARNRQLKIILESHLKGRGWMLMETIKPYCGQWQDVQLTLPWPAFSQLNMASFPLLQRLTLSPSHRSEERLLAGGILPAENKTILVQDAPLLNFAHVHLLSLDFARPLEQLTTLHCMSRTDVAHFIALLRCCPSLLDLSYSLNRTADVSHTPHELPHLRTLTVNDVHVLSVLTVPRLKRLGITAVHSIEDATGALKLLISRSACELQILTVCLVARTLPIQRFLCTANSVTHLILTLHASPVIRDHIQALHSLDVLPQLSHLEMRDIGGTEHYHTLLDLLTLRRTDAAFEICELFFGPNWPDFGPTPVLPPSIMDAFRALAEAGLQLRLEAREANTEAFALTVYTAILDTRR
ncbi:hypothetical protein C8R47DRAFT_518914 [Mycena vitilis]|nr:hypothetical protein C8R47DRAFT_518914 [Mycena vitilis]